MDSGALLKHVQRLSVVVGDLATVALADRYCIDEFSALGIILVRVVIRKKDAIGAPMVRIVQWSAWVLKLPLVVTQMFSAR